MIKWNYYHSNIHSILENEIRDNRNTDVTLVSEDLHEYKVHKFILSSSSPVLKEILVNNVHKHPLIYLNGIMNQDLEYLLLLIYSGEAAVNEGHLENFLNVAEQLELNGFEPPREEKIKNNTANAFQVVENNTSDENEMREVRGGDRNKKVEGE